MKLLIVGAAGKTGRQLVSEAIERGHEVVGVCRARSASRLDDYQDQPGFTLFTAERVSDAEILQQAVDLGCEAAIVISVSIRHLRASDIVRNLYAAGIRRVVLTAGEITAGRDSGERFTFRHRVMFAIFGPILWVLPISLRDMIRAGELTRTLDWNWTIVRAPTLTEGKASGYRACQLDQVTGHDRLSRRDYATALLDILADHTTYGRSITVVGDNS